MRGKLRTQLTKLCKLAAENVKHLEENERADSNELEKMKLDVDCILKRLVNTYEELKKLNKIIGEKTSPEDLDKECDAVIEYDDKAVNAIAQLENIIERVNKASEYGSVINVENQSRPQVMNIENYNRPQAMHSNDRGVNLRPIEIKKFNGNFEDWLPFWEQYKIAIHENAALSIATKFNFLNNALEGKAAESIKGFLPTESCYGEVIKLLQEEYGNNEKIIEKYSQKLIDIKPVHQASDIKGLRSLYNNVNSIMRTLNALNIETAKYDLLVNSILLKAIPRYIRTQYHRQSEQKENGSEGGQLKNLLMYLKIEIEAQEKSQLSEKEKENRNYEKENESRKFIRNGTATALYTNSSGSMSLTCVFCKNNSHSTKDCRNKKMTVDQKKHILKQEGRCFRCANKNHNSKNCKAQWLKCDVCNGRHITAVCERSHTYQPKEYQPKEYQPKVNHVESKSNNYVKPQQLISNQMNSSTSLCSFQNTKTYLQTAKIILMNPNNKNQILSRIIMDNGSQRTYITEALKNKLQLKKLKREKLQIVSFGRNNGKSEYYDLVELKIRSQYNHNVFIIEAVCVPSICLDMLPEPGLLSNKYPNLADVFNSNVTLLPGINVLIGQDYYWEFNTNQCKVLGDKLMLVNTKFGWTVQGSEISKGYNDINYTFNVCEMQETFNVEKFWSLEAIGISNNDEKTETKVLTNVQIKWKNNRYEVNLPWINKERTLNDNRQVAAKRLRILTAKLFGHEKIKQYDEEIRALLNNDIAEIVKYQNENARVYYMPHKAVYREDKSTTKVRIVFDASSSEHGLPSLNDCLSEGENMVADLVATIISFRSNMIVLIADIEKAYLQIALAEEDRDSHRFLWYKTYPQPGKALPSVVEYRMKRVTFGVKSSPFLLAITIKNHLQQNKDKYGEICEKIKKAFYVDDLIMSVGNREQAILTLQQSYEIMKAGSFNLRKWNSNDSEVLKYLPPDAVANVVCQKVLGINWCTATDEISVDLSECNKYINNLQATKRGVLKAMARVYDPLGILGPFTVRVKILLQRIWKENLEWDQTLSEELSTEFRAWQEELLMLKEFTMKRCLIANEKYISNLHVFCDASLLAYGAVVYLRQISENGLITSIFVCSKNRIRPLKKCNKNNELSLPKLELTAALIGARLQSFLRKSLTIKIGKTLLWTDSTIALSWIKGQGNQNAYIKARTEEIKNLTSECEWRHCQGKSNPADLTTRGVKAKALLESDIWKFGPPWLLESDCYWPSTVATNIVATLLAVSDSSPIVEINDPVLSINNYSSVHRLFRVTAIILKFTKMLRFNANIIRANNEPIIAYGEIQEAEMYWVKYEQMKYYKAEIEAISKYGEVLVTSTIKSLNPQLENGILKVRSRLADGGYEKPIILPKQSYLSLLLIREAHHMVLHGGVNTVLAHMRKKYWIVQGRQLIKNILKNCVICKRLHGKAASEPWTTIPRERVETSRPFETTGVDFAGPLYVLNKSSDKLCKVYIMLFTCAAIRAVHLELVTDMTTKSCIDAIRRFIARRGVPKTIISDNARTFKRTDMELRKLEDLLKKDNVQQLALKKGINWKSIPERAAWWGGFWERLVRSVKTALKAAIGKTVLNQEELATMLVEVESATNARPLTYITDDVNDFEPLTPAHFLINVNATLIPYNFKSDGSKLSKSWEKRQALMKRFLKRWQIEYLNQLRTLHHNKNGVIRSVQKGDIVLVQEDFKSRLMWKLALVHQTFPGRDGKVRACDIRFSNGQILKRPIRLLYPLEISASFPGGRM